MWTLVDLVAALILLVYGLLLLGFMVIILWVVWIFVVTAVANL